MPIALDSKAVAKELCCTVTEADAIVEALADVKLPNGGLRVTMQKLIDATRAKGKLYHFNDGDLHKREGGQGGSPSEDQGSRGDKPLGRNGAGRPRKAKARIVGDPSTGRADVQGVQDALRELSESA